VTGWKVSSSDDPGCKSQGTQRKPHHEMKPSYAKRTCRFGEMTDNNIYGILQSKWEKKKTSLQTYSPGQGWPLAGRKEDRKGGKKGSHHEGEKAHPKQQLKIPGGREGKGGGHFVSQSGNTTGQQKQIQEGERRGGVITSS